MSRLAMAAVRGSLSVGLDEGSILKFLNSGFDLSK